MPVAVQKFRPVYLQHCGLPQRKQVHNYKRKLQRMLILHNSGVHPLHVLQRVSGLPELAFRREQLLQMARKLLQVGRPCICKLVLQQLRHRVPFLLCNSAVRSAGVRECDLPDAVQLVRLPVRFLRIKRMLLLPALWDLLCAGQRQPVQPVLVIQQLALQLQLLLLQLDLPRLVRILPSQWKLHKVRVLPKHQELPGEHVDAI